MQFNVYQVPKGTVPWMADFFFVGRAPTWRLCTNDDGQVQVQRD